MWLNNENYFKEENINKFNSFYWFVRIWDFKLEKKWQKTKIIENAKVGISVYWINSIDELKDTKKKITIVIPALTWNSKLFSNNTNSSQWEWWANWYEKWILKPDEDNIIIWLDYFWWPYDSSSPQKHNLSFYDVSPKKQVEAWKKTLTKLWIKSIDTLFWWSNWWWHIIRWIIDPVNTFLPKNLITIAGSFWNLNDSKDFFKIQSEIIQISRSKNKHQKLLKIKKRLIKDIKPILNNIEKENSLYKFFFKNIIKEIDSLEFIEWKEKSIREALGIAREIWFLRFVNPDFYEKFWKDKNWNNILNIEEAQSNLLQYFKNEKLKFENRFSASTLSLLCNWIVKTQNIKPEIYAEKIKNDINIIVLWIENDNLFSSKKIKKYFNNVKNKRTELKHTWVTHFIELSWEDTKKAWHDYFLWKSWIKEIIKKLYTFFDNFNKK